MKATCKVKYNLYFLGTFSLLRPRLHQASALTLRQLYDDARDTVLVAINSVVQKWVATPFWNDSIVFNENRITRIIVEFSQI